MATISIESLHQFFKWWCYHQIWYKYSSRIIPKKGQTKAQDFAQGLQENPTTFCDPVKRNRVDFFSQETATVEPSKQKLVKEDCQLFSKLFISCQSREPVTCRSSPNMRISPTPLHWVMVENFMLARNRSWPPSLKPTSHPQKKSFGPSTTTKKKEDIWGLCSTWCSTQYTAYAIKYKSTHIVSDVYNPSSLKMEIKIYTRPGRWTPSDKQE